MRDWTPGEWGLFFTALGGFVTIIGNQFVQMWLQVKGIKKSEENNVLAKAAVVQTNEIARAVPDASTTPTDSLITSEGKKP